MAKTRITRKNLKEDEIHDFSLAAVEWVRQRQRTLVVVGVLIVVALLGRMTYKSRQESARRGLDAKYGAAYRLRMEGVDATEPGEGETKLERARSLYQEIADADGNGKVGRLAFLSQANILLDLERFDEARAAFNTCLERARTPEEEAAAYLALGDCDDSQAFRDKDGATTLTASALKNYDAAHTAAPSSCLAGYSLFCKARILRRNPETRDAALKALDQLARERALEDASMIVNLKPEDYGQNDARDVQTLLNAAQSRTFAKLAEYLKEEIQSTQKK
jgi:tetratricopeptide (TPR) repeat protein